MAFKNGDFIELDYTGRKKDDNSIFDTTIKKVADDAGIHTHNKFESVIIVLGKHQILPAIDSFLEGKEPGTYNLDLEAQFGFGKKDAKLLRLVPLRLFKKENIQPFVGLEVNIDNQPGIVRTVSGARIIVDFNHPLAGQDIIYELTPKRQVTDDKEKVTAVLKLLGLTAETITIQEKKAVITLKQELSKEPATELAKIIKDMIGLEASFAKAEPAKPKSEPVKTKAEPVKKE